MKPSLKTITTVAFTSFSTPVLAEACSALSPVTLTFYGYPDNDPPSAEIAYDCGRGNTAGGNGTYDDPLTAATAPGEFDDCEIVYLPYIQKYVRIEDTCAKCIKNWNKKDKEHHVDIWIPSTASDEGPKVLDCENALTPKMGISVIRDPGMEYKVVYSPLYAAGKCHTENTFGASDVPGGCSGSASGDADSEKENEEETTPSQTSSAARISVAAGFHPDAGKDSPTRKDSGFVRIHGLRWWEALVLGVVVHLLCV